MEIQKSYFYSSNNGTSTIISLVILLFNIICWYKIFKKAGEDGWKAIIPVYSDFICFRLFLSTKLFIIKLLAILFDFILIIFLFFKVSIDTILATNNASIDSSQMVRVVLEMFSKNMIFLAIIIFLMLVAFVIGIMQKYYTLKSFGKGGAWLFLYIFFEIFVDAYLAFGNVYYEGNKYLND